MTNPVPSSARPALAKNALAGMFATGIGPATNLSSCTNAKVPTSLPDLSKLPLQYQQAISEGSVQGLASALIAESMVLLKNERGTLPLSLPGSTTASSRANLFSNNSSV